MTLLNLPQFPDAHLLTNSAESTFKTCPRKFYLSYVLGLRSRFQSEPLRLGSAVHLGLETLKMGGDEQTAAQAIRDVYETSERPAYLEPHEFSVECETAVALVVGWARRYAGQEIIEFVAVEIPFDLPITNPVTGAATPIFRCAGKIDAIVRLPDGRIALMEHKTTSDDIGHDSDYWRRLMMDSQISRYVLAARELGHDVQTTIYDVIKKPGIRPLAMPLTDEQGVKIVLDAAGQRVRTKDGKKWRESADSAAGYVLQTRTETPTEYGVRLTADTASRPDFYFARNEIPRLENDLEEFRFEQWQIQRTIRQAQNDGRWYRNTNACVHPYRCGFFDVCRGLKGDANDKTIPDGFRRATVLHEELAVLQHTGGVA